MKKKRKVHIKWRNVFRLIVLMCSIAIIVNDIYMLVIYPFVHNETTGLTLYGCLTEVLAIFVAYITFDELREEYMKKSVSTSAIGKHAYKQM